MKVVTKANEFIALRYDNTNEFYFELGHYLPSNSIRKDNNRFSDTIYLKNVNDTETIVKYNDYIIFDKRTKECFCLPDEMFQKLFVEVKEDNDEEI